MTDQKPMLLPPTRETAHEIDLHDAGNSLHSRANNRGYRRRKLADEAIARRRAVCRRQLYRSGSADCVRAALKAVRAVHRCGKPRRRWWYHRSGVCRQVGTGWLYRSGQRSRPHDRPGALPEACLSPRP